MALEDELLNRTARLGIRRLTTAVDIEDTRGGFLGRPEIERRQPDAWVGVEEDFLDGIAVALDLADPPSAGLGQACERPNACDAANLGNRLGAILRAPEVLTRRCVSLHE